jgi:hypothetical protein
MGGRAADGELREVLPSYRSRFRAGSMQGYYGELMHAQAILISSAGRSVLEGRVLEGVEAVRVLLSMWANTAPLLKGSTPSLCEAM